MLTYVYTNLWLLWLIISFVCLIVELSSGDFYFVCFALGALVSIIFAAFDAPFIAQLLAWVIASVFCLVFVRPSLVRRLHNKKERKSNADALMGRQGRVVETIQAGGFGRVQIDGDIWKAVTKGDADIPEGSNVVVIDRASTIITVELLKN